MNKLCDSKIFSHNHIADMVCYMFSVFIMKDSSEFFKKPPSTSDYFEALQVIRAYLGYLGCNQREMDALQILESKLK